MTTWTAITTAPERAPAEALGEALEGLAPDPSGIGVFEVEDGSGVWEVAGYFTEKPDGVALDLLAAAHGTAPFAVSKLDDRDWVAQVRRELSPVEVGRFVVHGGHDTHRVGPHKIGLLIEAAMAFGTGHHATTRGCLRLFERRLRAGLRPLRVADVGCGTGVLAMAAARAARARVRAGDIEAQAVATARANAAANGAAPRILVGEGPGFRSAVLREGGPYDLIFANILAGPLKRLAPEIARHLAPGGAAILSGILGTQAHGVEAIYRGHGLWAVDRVREEGWTSLALAASPIRNRKGRPATMRSGP